VTATKTDAILAKMTDKIVHAIEDNLAGKWEKPWTTLLAGARFPVNAVTENHYKGMNMIAGMVEVMVEEYDTNVWATYRQWQSIEAQVRKGEKGTGMIKWNKGFSCDVCGSRGRAPCRNKAHPNSTFMWGAGFSVFNADQVDGYEPAVAGPDHEPVVEVEAMIASTGASIDVKISNEAFWMPTEDIIVIPLMGQFNSAEQYYGTLLHELTHWTGHEDRLDRDRHKTFGDDSYAHEELIAELGAIFTAAHYGLEVEPHPEHINYLAGWLKTLKAEPKALYDAAKQAQAAFEYMTEETE